MASDVLRWLKSSFWRSSWTKDSIFLYFSWSHQNESHGDDFNINLIIFHAHIWKLDSWAGWWPASQVVGVLGDWNHHSWVAHVFPDLGRLNCRGTRGSGSWECFYPWIDETVYDLLWIVWRHVVLSKAKPKLSAGRFQRATTLELIHHWVISLCLSQLSMLFLVYNVLREAGWANKKSSPTIANGWIPTQARLWVVLWASVLQMFQQSYVWPRAAFLECGLKIVGIACVILSSFTDTSWLMI